jgi:hypothetical protein
MKLASACFLFAILASPALLPAETITLSAIQDNTIYDDTTALSNGAGEFIHTGRTREGRVRRGLIAFDIAGNLPANAIITDVRLALNLSQANDVTIEETSSLFRLLNSWGEGTSNAAGGEGSGAPATDGDATWVNRFHPDTPWDALGGDFVPAPSATIDVSGLGLYFWEADGMIADVQDWLGDPDNNFGWIIRTGDEQENGAGKRFDSRTHPETAFRPSLRVDYEIIPEPSTAALAGLSFLGAAFVTRLRRRQR